MSARGRLADKIVARTVVIADRIIVGRDFNVGASGADAKQKEDTDTASVVIKAARFNRVASVAAPTIAGLCGLLLALIKSATLIAVVGIIGATTTLLVAILAGRASVIVDILRQLVPRTSDAVPLTSTLAATAHVSAQPVALSLGKSVALSLAIALAAASGAYFSVQLFLPNAVPPPVVVTPSPINQDGGMPDSALAINLLRPAVTAPPRAIESDRRGPQPPSDAGEGPSDESILFKVLTDLRHLDEWGHVGHHIPKPPIKIFAEAFATDATAVIATVERGSSSSLFPVCSLVEGISYVVEDARIEEQWNRGITAEQTHTLERLSHNLERLRGVECQPSTFDIEVLGFELVDEDTKTHSRILDIAYSDRKHRDVHPVRFDAASDAILHDLLGRVSSAGTVKRHTYLSVKRIRGVQMPWKPLALNTHRTASR